MPRVRNIFRIFVNFPAIFRKLFSVLPPPRTYPSLKLIFACFSPQWALVSSREKHVLKQKIFHHFSRVKFSLVLSTTNIFFRDKKSIAMQVTVLQKTVEFSQNLMFPEGHNLTCLILSFSTLKSINEKA